MIHSGVCCYLGLIPGDVGRVKVHSSMGRDKMSTISAHMRQEWSREKEKNAETLQIIHHFQCIDPSSGVFSDYYKTVEAKEKGGGS